MERATLKSVAIGVGLVLGSALVIAGPALADDVGTMPSGCWIIPSNPSLTSASPHKVIYGGGASCPGHTVSSIDWRLVHDYGALPDVRVAFTNVKVNAGTLYGQVCDGGGTTKYYSEIGLNGLPTTVQRVSSSVTLTHC